MSVSEPDKMLSWINPRMNPFHRFDGFSSRQGGSGGWEANGRNHDFGSWNRPNPGPDSYPPWDERSR